MRALMHQMSVCGKFTDISKNDLLCVSDRFGIAAAILNRAHHAQHSVN